MPVFLLNLHIHPHDKQLNFSGVRGIGKKGALKLVQDHGGIEQIYENLSSLTLPVRTRLEQGRDSAFLSRDLIRLKTGVDIQERPCTPCNCDRNRLKVDFSLFLYKYFLRK